MFSWLGDLREVSIFFNLFRYLTFRSGGAVMTALTLSFIIGPFLIGWLGRRQTGQNTIREDVPAGHYLKTGTPTMGGVMILIVFFLTVLLWADLSTPLIWLVLWIVAVFGALGFIDDYQKLYAPAKKGLKAREKFLLQLLLALPPILIHVTLNPEASFLTIPFLKNVVIDMGVLYVPFALLVVVGASNAVNLTDGLDGLAIVPTMIVAASLGFIAYLVGNHIYADYLGIVFIREGGELVIVSAAFIGAGLGFLWFNAPPAKIFMGDIGSLALGGGLGMMAVLTRHEIVLTIIGGLFVLETASVIAQVFSFKLTGKRIFAMAPLHHHFEKKGWSESTIVIRFWIIAFIMAMIGLSSLKIR